MILWQAFSVVVILMLGGWYGESVVRRKFRFGLTKQLHETLMTTSSFSELSVYPSTKNTSCVDPSTLNVVEMLLPSRVQSKPLCYDPRRKRTQIGRRFQGQVNIAIGQAVFFSGVDESKLRALIQQAVREAMGGYNVQVSIVPNGTPVPVLPITLPPFELTDGTPAPVDTKLKPSMLMKDAGPIWLKTRKPFVAANTYERKRHNLNQVIAFFGEKTLAQCADGDLVREYQDKRRASAGGDCINHECQILSEVLTRIGLWKQVKDDYQPLPVKTSTAGRALSPEEEKLFVAAANSNEDWKVAYWIAVLAAHTLLSPSEIFNRQIRDLDMRNEQLLIPQGKNNFRVREVPLNKHALNCARLLFDRAKELGAWKPDHYLLPYRVRVGEYDPTRPAKSCRSAWRALTRSIGLRGLRPKDMRHHGITVLDETKISPRVTRALAGHSPNSRLLDRYSHPRKAAKKAAVKVLENKVKLA